MKYRIYIDEVGNPDLDSSDNPNHRYLSLTGIITELRYSDSIIHPQMESLKRKYFSYHSDDPIIFHRKEMVRRLSPFECLKDPEKRQAFDEELLNLLNSWQYTVITVCIDKKRHKETYSTWRYDTYHYCLAVLLERFVFFLEQSGSNGDVMAESRGGKADMRLKASYRRLLENGTSYVDPDRFKTFLTSRELKVKPKLNNISGLQIADLLAHESRNEILAEQDIPNNLSAFAQKTVEILQLKYYRRTGVIYGKKFI